VVVEEKPAPAPETKMVVACVHPRCKQPTGLKLNGQPSKYCEGHLESARRYHYKQSKVKKERKVRPTKATVKAPVTVRTPLRVQPPTFLVPVEPPCPVLPPPTQQEILNAFAFGKADEMTERLRTIPGVQFIRTRQYLPGGRIVTKTDIYIPPV